MTLPGRSLEAFSLYSIPSIGSPGDRRFAS